MVVLAAAPLLGCFEDPEPSTTTAGTETGDGDGDGDGDSGDGDGDSGDGDGDSGDGDGDSGDGDGDSGDGDGDGDPVEPLCDDGVVVATELCLSDTATQYAAGQSALRLAVAEFDPDTLGVVVVGGSAQASVLRGDGSGALLDAELVELLGASSSVATGDIDNDGDGDFVTDGNPLTVLRNDGNGGWEDPPIEIMSGFVFDSFRVVVGQIDGSAPLDVIYTEGYNTVWHTGKVFGGWSPDPSDGDQFTGGDSWLFLTEYGFDGDGFADLLVASQWEAKVAVTRGMGNGTFVQQGEAFICAPGACEIVELHAADLNGDDDPDIVASFDSGFSVLMANGDGTFANYQLSASPGADHISSGDIDNDGDIDLVVASRDDGDLRLHLNDGSGAFADPLVFSVPGDSTRTTAMVDLDGDGAMELITAYDYNGGGWVAVFEANP